MGARATDGLLTAFNEKNGNTGAGTINGGVYLMKRALLDEIPEEKFRWKMSASPGGCRREDVSAAS